MCCQRKIKDCSSISLQFEPKVGEHRLLWAIAGEKEVKSRSGNSQVAAVSSRTQLLLDRWHHHSSTPRLKRSSHRSKQAIKLESKQESKQRYHSNKEGAKRVKSEHFWPTTAVATDYFWWSSATTTEVWWQRVEKTQREPETTTKSKSSQQSNSAGVQET